MARIASSIETVVVVGGHLPPGRELLVAREDAAETPIGLLYADADVIKSIESEFSLREDAVADNTVEVQLPIVSYLFPDAKYVGLRASPSAIAIELGAFLAALAAKTGRTLAVIGSTDLTHYGTAYGFAPRGTGEEAAAWVRDVNDAEFIDCMATMDFTGAITSANEHQSACSAGGAVTAGEFARASGADEGEVLIHTSSREKHAFGGSDDSFVGYCGIAYPVANTQSA
jgi:AmmeMemoRadiSam system protein B